MKAQILITYEPETMDGQSVAENKESINDFVRSLCCGVEHMRFRGTVRVQHLKECSKQQKRKSKTP